MSQALMGVLTLIRHVTFCKSKKSLMSNISMMIGFSLALPNPVKCLFLKYEI